MRFYCEWCYEQVGIVDRQQPYNEVLGHFTSCSRRSPLTTEEQVLGLAEHIASIIADHHDESRMRQAG